ncbi:cyclin-dependent kinase inhibitor 7-like [Cucurbita pepo subsp. pepo]|uniref:cyclin-dependent kinase inhibitor 7-like n=1 Tax=Cucurbita pepo subsp. pepo TaxID=3664 RepID=UPI000C9DA4B8|nr:cyclin-dependent kinase inhibitor 7-like [Cucurbita pepo subsp. pepo]
MVRKCRAVAEIAVMEVDVRRTTRPPPDLEDVPHSSTSTSANKRQITAGTDFHFSTATTSFVKLPRRRRRLVLPLESSLRQPSTTSTEERSSTSPISDVDASAFCCSSNGCSEVVEESSKFVDLEDEEKDEHGIAYKSSRERRETTPSSHFQSTMSGDMESLAMKTKATSGNGSSSSSMKKPAESELEEFFTAAEKKIQKRFAEKYNYDIVEDVPLEGRYEWIRLKP